LLACRWKVGLSPAKLSEEWVLGCLENSSLLVFEFVSSEVSHMHMHETGCLLQCMFAADALVHCTHYLYLIKRIHTLIHWRATEDQAHLLPRCTFLVVDRAESEAVLARLAKKKIHEQIFFFLPQERNSSIQ